MPKKKTRWKEKKIKISQNLIKTEIFWTNKQLGSKRKKKGVWQYPNLLKINQRKVIIFAELYPYDFVREREYNIPIVLCTVTHLFSSLRHSVP